MSKQTPTTSQIAIAKFREIEPDTIEKAVSNIINMLNKDLFTLLVNGKTILIKPNWASPVLVGFPDYWPVEKYATSLLANHTNPYVVTAIAKIVRDAGARRIIIGESPALSPFTYAYENLYVNAKNTMNLKEEVEVPEFIEVADFNNEKQHIVKVNNPYTLDKVIVPQTVIDVDVIISIARLKTHRMARITAGLKNMALGGVPSSASSEAAAEAGSWRKWLEFEKAFIDLPISEKKKIALKFAKSRLHGVSVKYFPERAGRGLQVIEKNSYRNAIMFPEYDLWEGAEIADLLEAQGGIDFTLICADYGVEGESPHIGEKAFPVDMKERIGSYLLIGGFDPVACDAVAARIIGWSNDEITAWPGIPALHFCSMKKMGVNDLSSIKVLGLADKPIQASSLNLPNATFMRAPWENRWWWERWLPAIHKYGEPQILPELKANGKC